MYGGGARGFGRSLAQRNVVDYLAVDLVHGRVAGVARRFCSRQRRRRRRAGPFLQALAAGGDGGGWRR